MENITTSSELLEAIKILEAEQDFKGQVLKTQFFLTYESLKPINLINSTLKDISSSPYLLDNILGTAMGLVSGFLSRKLIVGGSSSIIRKLLGSILQFGVTNIVAQHPDMLKNLSHFIMQFISPNKSSPDKP
ncbi:MAG: hypothetical protein IPH84_01735 [Bacteroidales bacterium]|nr:hypothetical protein [Bacteroidales bacterium]